MTRPLREATVDLAAIRTNVGVLRTRIGAEHLMAVVKANAYGHGAVQAARAAVEGGADWLGVVSLTEALALRAAGLTVPILAWLHEPQADFGPAIAAGIDIGVNYLEQLDAVAASSTVSSPGVVQLKVDTGLGRNGAADADWHELFAAAASHERAGRLSVRGIFSHLANAGAEEDRRQIESFDRAIAAARAAGLDPELLHLAATAGALSEPHSRYNLVRIGIGTYGLSPLPELSAPEIGITPALALSASIVSVKRVPAGSGVSYGYSYRTTADTTLVLVPLGYGDGIPRQASGRGPISINGRTFTVTGRIAMDQFVVDVGDLPVALGDRAILFGDPRTGIPSADDWALAADTINYEIVTRLGGRIEWTFVG